MPSLLLTSAVLLSSRIMSMHNSTHSSQMNTVGPAMSLRTSCWLLPQKEQYSVLLLSPLAALVIVLVSLSNGAFAPENTDAHAAAHISKALQDTRRELSNP